MKGQVKAVPPLELSSRLCGTLSKATGESLKARRPKKKKKETGVQGQGSWKERFVLLNEK